MAFTGPQEDRLAIRDLYGTYTDASSRGDRESWLTCFTEDGQWNTHLFEVSGRDALRQQWDALWANFTAVSFLSEIGMMQVTDNNAKARAFTREVILLTNGKIYRLAGQYDDELVRVHGEWLFARRHYRPVVDEEPK
jgi:uncharacterized protein (TIGR02246 family)